MSSHRDDSSEEASSVNMRRTTTSEDSEGTHDDVTTPRSASSNPNPGNIDSGMLEKKTIHFLISYIRSIQENNFHIVERNPKYSYTRKN